MTQWYYELSGQQAGPVSHATLQDLMQSGAIGAETLVWSGGMTEWAAARTVVNASSGPTVTTPPFDDHILAGKLQPPQYQSIEDLSKWSILMFRVGGGISILTIFLILAAIGDEDWGTVANLTSGDTSSVFGALSGAQSLLTVVLFCIWLYRATTNLIVLHNRPLEMSPAWAVGSFFVPVFNFFAPYKGLKQLYQGATGRQDGSVGLWWGLFIAGLVGATFSALFETEGSMDAAAATGWMLISLVALSVSAFVGANCIERINEGMRQQAQLHFGAR